MTRFVVAAATLLLAVPAAAAVPDALLCDSAITAAEERGATTPPGLLTAISQVESGRPDRSGTVRAWPWSIDVAGTDYVFRSKVEAVAATRAWQASGVASIDVGCMQINLAQHPNAFATLDAAFAPAGNVAYAIDFLVRLHGGLGDWAKAAAAYHSSTPAIGAAYQRLVLARWTPQDTARPAIPANATPQFARRLAELDDERAARRARFGRLQRSTEPRTQLAQLSR